MARRRKIHRGRRKKKGFAAFSLGKKIATIVAGALAVVLIVGVAASAIYIKGVYGEVQGEQLDVSALEINEEAQHRTGTLNIALFGVDTRKSNLGKGTRSDSIMICSLNQETGEVRVCSVYRDTLLQQSDGTLNKANAAYSFGGVKGAVALLNRNLDLDIDHYVTVNFNALVDIIDAIGGVEIKVTDDEVEWINYYLAETAKAAGEDKYDQVTKSGKQTLSGVQATSYCRIRYTTGDDYRRALRQRKVLEQIIKKLQKSSLTTLTKVANEIYDEVATNFTLEEILSYASDYKHYTLSETAGFPFGKTTYTLDGVGSSVVPATLESNVIQLQQFLYGDDVDYTPSEKVKTISESIVAQTGTTEMEASNPELSDSYKDTEANRKSSKKSSSEDETEETVEVVDVSESGSNE